MNIIFLGPPGSGKGTQSLMLEKEFGFKRLSTGDLLRKEVEEGSNLGIKIKSVIESGSYVPDEIMINILSKKIFSEKFSKGFILDGFPRTLEQAKALDFILAKSNRMVNCVLELKVRDDLLIERISGRFSCSNCGATYNQKIKNLKTNQVCDNCGGRNFIFRKDDNPLIMKKRLEVYHQQMSVLLSYYKSKEILHSVDGMDDIDLVSEQIKLIVKSVANMLT